jgi:hypothetical protein
VKLIVSAQRRKKCTAINKGQAMDFLAFLIVLGCILLLFKVLGAIFKAGIFLISIPLQIIAAVFVAVVLFFALPAALFSGLFAVILIPLGILAPLLPFILVGLGIYLLARR